jgi:HEPN domain-containing protein
MSLNAAAEELQHATKRIRQARRGLRNGKEKAVLNFAVENLDLAVQRFLLGEADTGNRYRASAYRQTIQALTLESNYERTELLAAAIAHMTTAYYLTVQTRTLA